MRTLLTSILLASASLAPIYMLTAQTASEPTSTPALSEAEMKQRQEFLADLKAKADKGDQEAAAWYIYSKMIFSTNMDEARLEKAKLKALGDGGNAHAVKILKHHEARKTALLPDSTNEQKIAGARSASELNDTNNVDILLRAVATDKNVSSIELISVAELFRDWGSYRNAIRVLEHPVAKKDPAAIGLEGRLMLEDEDPNNTELAEIFIRRAAAAAAGDQKSIATIAEIDGKNRTNAEALLARSNEGSYAARLELAEAYFSGSVPGIPQDLEKAKELAKYVASAPSEVKTKEKLFGSYMILGQIAEKQGEMKDASRYYGALDSGYNLDIDLRSRGQYLRELVIRPLRETYRNQIDYAREYMGLTNPGTPKDMAKAKSALAKAMAVDFDDGYREAYFLTAQILESEKDYWNAYESYVKSFMQSGDGNGEEALSSIIRLEKTKKENIIITTNYQSTALREARASAGILDYSDPAFHSARFASSSPSTASSIANADDMPSAVREAIAAFNAEIDNANKRFDLAEQLITAANSGIVEIHKGDWSAYSGDGPDICNKLKTAVALRNSGIYYLNRGYNEASNIPDKFPQRASAFSTFEQTKSAIDASNRDVNSSSNDLGCWSGNYSGQGDLWLRNGL